MLTSDTEENRCQALHYFDRGVRDTGNLFGLMGKVKHVFRNKLTVVFQVTSSDYVSQVTHYFRIYVSYFFYLVTLISHFTDLLTFDDRLIIKNDFTFVSFFVFIVEER